MASTTFSGPVTSTNGFVGAVTGNITGDVTGNVTGNVAGNVTGNVTGDLTGRTFGTVTALSGAGAVPVTSSTVRLTTTGANALTLANGTNGQLLTIVMVVDGGDGTLTPTTKTGYTTITFNDAGDAVTLQYFTTLGWMIVSNYGTTVA
jgi:trimeric autotransporter adhesin